MARTPEIAVLATALLLAPGILPTGSAMTTSEFEAALADMQARVDEAAAAYARGDRGSALAAAHAVAQRFTFDAAGTSALEAKLKEASAVAIGDKVKAYAAKLVAAIEADAPAAQVKSIADELAPSLNRLVLVAQGKASAASQRQLKTTQAIDHAIAEVEKSLDDATRWHEGGQRAKAVDAAKDAFFTFEINGLGPDLSSVDDRLENEVENLIVNFDASTVRTQPGLSQLIENGATPAEVLAHAARIKAGLAEVRELLEATLPPFNLGDANGDGRITIVDALFVAQAALGIRAQTEAMDVNRDGRITIVDALFVAQAALGIRSL